MMEEVRTTSKGYESKERMTPTFKLYREARDFDRPSILEKSIIKLLDLYQNLNK